MSTRRVDIDDTCLQFDHGAQFFTARDPRFAKRVEGWVEAGHVARWPEGQQDAWIGQPAMNAPLLAMAENLKVSVSTRIETLTRDNGHWHLHGGGVGETAYDAVVVAVPAEQAVSLLAPQDATMAAYAESTRSKPCWTVMAAFDTRVTASETGPIRNRGAIEWAVRDSSKTGREDRECWVIHATPDWSLSHLEDERETVVSALLESLSRELEDAPNAEAVRPIYAAAHRWRYARSGAADVSLLWNNSIGLGACGDWLMGPRVECAWLSGATLGDAILTSMGSD
ncbi:putative transmembrane protein [Fulvimarina pelagi HTCC2506]|uniref:Putative transmembrane protein n=2 Tax=Fulvimarina pelagi TaxID=217511 RepID=Q0FYJ1_9HYPH|nr:putative transmembrane protein [Fulvimarina pelagi HTCC2506]